MVGMEIDPATLQSLEKELADINPRILRYFEQLIAKNPPTARKIVQNVLDEGIPPEVQERQPKPLHPKPYQPKAPPRQRKARRRQELLRTFDPVRPHHIQTVTDYQKEILDLYFKCRKT